MSLRWDIQEALRRFPRRAARRGARRGARPAAVALAVATGAATEGSDGAVFITRRTDSFRARSGHYVLPGGRLAPGETVSEAARRELGVELGIWLSQDAVLGLLDDYVTRSKYLITPVVLWAGAHDLPPRPREAEIADAFAVPFAELDVDPVFVAIPESDHPVIRLPLRGGWMHAPSAAVLHQFREVVLHRRRTRVAHFEQPVLAWG